MKKPARNFGLDLLRATAVAGVLVAHLSIWIMEVGQWTSLQIRDWAAASFTGGFFGVELFYAMSGYLMGLAALRDFPKGVTLASLKNYYGNRVMRILPAYYAAIILLGLGAWYLGAPTPTYRHFLFLYDPVGVEPFFPIGWTLSVQMLFYLLVPLFFLSHARLSLVIGGILIISASRILYSLGSAPEFEMMHRLPILRIDGLLVGVLVALLEKERPALIRPFIQPSAIALIGVLLALAMYLMAKGFSDGIEIRTKWAPWIWAALLLAVPLAFALLMPGIQQRASAPKWLVRFVMVLSIGSYSFYLVHQDIFALLRRTEIVGNAEWGPYAGVGVALLAAFVLFKTVEQPFMRMRKPNGKTRA